ncbi:MAG: hypothetical protein ACXWMS_10890 [Syntrophales bacterium]
MAGPPVSEVRGLFECPLLAPRGHMALSVVEQPDHLLIRRRDVGDLKRNCESMKTEPEQKRKETQIRSGTFGNGVFT